MYASASSVLTALLLLPGVFGAAVNIDQQGANLEVRIPQEGLAPTTPLPPVPVPTGLPTGKGKGRPTRTRTRTRTFTGTFSFPTHIPTGTHTRPPFTPPTHTGTLAPPPIPTGKGKGFPTKSFTLGPKPTVSPA